MPLLYVSEIDTPMPIPGSVEITEYACDPVATDSTCSVDPCRNPLWAIDHPDDCDAVTLTAVRTEPENISIVAGRRGHVRVVAEFSNGSEADVTDAASLTAEDTGVAEVVSASDGVVRGLAAGEAYVDGAYGGYTARTTVSVLDSTDVDSVSWDVVFVLDLSAANHVISSRSLTADASRVVRSFSGSEAVVPGYYWQALRPIGDGASIDVLDDLLKQAQLSLSLTNDWDDDPGDDRFALVVTGDGHPYTYQGWTDTYITAPFAYAFSDCALGDAMEQAQALIGTARTASRKMVVVFTAGTETSCAPSAKSVATAIKAVVGNKVAVVTPLESVSRTGTTIYSACSFPQTSYDNLQETASPGCFFGGRLWADVAAAFGPILDNAF